MNKFCCFLIECAASKFDLVILIDNSGSIEALDHEGYFEQVKMFIKKLVETFKIGTGVNVALVEASSDARVIAKFGDIKDKASFDQYINNLQYKKERSFLGMTNDFLKFLLKCKSFLIYYDNGLV